MAFLFGFVAGNAAVILSPGRPQKGVTFFWNNTITRPKNISSEVVVG